jgi:type III restriction enzyme
VAKILVQAGWLAWTKDNPAAFVELAHKAISLARRDILTQGITYKRTGAYFEQTLFKAEGVDADSLVAVENAPLTHIRVDSKTIERPIAEQLDRVEPVTLCAKLPPDFKIDTPLGAYNPD